jgi:hypothetical protein
MKVYEIITNEAIIPDVLGKVAKTLAPLAKRNTVINRAANIKNIKANNALSASAAAAAKNSNTVKAALALPEWAGLYKLFTLLGLGVPVYRYYTHMSVNKAELDAGEISKVEFDSRRQAEMTLLTESIVAFFAARTITWLTFGPIKMLLGLPLVRSVPGAMGLSKLLSTVDKSAGAAVLVAVNTDWGRELMAKTLGGIIETIFGAAPVAAIAALESFIRDKAGMEQDKYAPGNYDKFQKPSSAVDATSGEPIPIGNDSDRASIKAGWKPGSGYN